MFCFHADSAASLFDEPHVLVTIFYVIITQSLSNTLSRAKKTMKNTHVRFVYIYKDIHLYALLRAN